MSNTASAVAQVQTQSGEVTPFTTAAITQERMLSMQERIEAATTAPKTAFKDETPMYWQARLGEVMVLVFMGWKLVLKTDEKTGEETRRYMPIFHDGRRPVLMGQLTAVEAMMGKEADTVWRITCTRDVAGKAKTFTFEKFEQ